MQFLRLETSIGKKNVLKTKKKQRKNWGESWDCWGANVKNGDSVDVYQSYPTSWNFLHKRWIKKGAYEHIKVLKCQSLETWEPEVDVHSIMNSVFLSPFSAQEWVVHFGEHSWAYWDEFRPNFLELTCVLSGNQSLGNDYITINT